jgi:glutathione S-transferase
MKALRPYENIIHSRLSMYSLYIANKNYSSWSLRPWVLMQALAIPFEEKLVPFQESNWQEFRTFSPTGKVPCLHDGEITVWDSLAIAEYLAESHPGVWAEDRLARAWSRSAAAEMHSGFSPLRQQCSMNCGIRIQLHAISSSLQQDIDRLNELWGEGLDRFGGLFLAGDKFTAVDAFFAPVAFRVQTYNLPLSEQAIAYVDRLLALPAMHSWQSAALQEPWREVGHEAEVLQSGTLTADYRQA